MDFISYLLNELTPDKYLAIGLAFSVLGGVFWYMPRSNGFKNQEKSQLDLASKWRRDGFESNGIKLERFHEKKNRRLPIYGKLLVTIGFIILAVASGNL